MSCIRANIDIEIVEGGTFNKTYRWSTGTPSAPVDLTGYTGNMQVRAKVKSVDVLIDVPFQTDPWTPDGLTGIYILPSGSPDTDKGTWQIYMKDEDTEGMCALHKDIIGAYDCFLYNPYDEAVLQMYGTATIKAAVTRNE